MWYHVLGMDAPRILKILALLLTTRSSSKIIHAAIDGVYSKEQVSKSLYSLKKKGLAKYHNGKWIITREGRRYYREKRWNLYRYFYFDDTKSKSRKMIIIFDIPEKERSKRDWLRSQLKLFGFKQIQKSVWFGPRNLPKEFFAYLKELGIKEYIKMFKTSGKL